MARREHYHAACQRVDDSTPAPGDDVSSRTVETAAFMRSSATVTRSDNIRNAPAAPAVNRTLVLRDPRAPYGEQQLERTESVEWRWRG